MAYYEKEELDKKGRTGASVSITSRELKARKSIVSSININITHATTTMTTHANELTIYMISKTTQCNPKLRPLSIDFPSISSSIHARSIAGVYEQGNKFAYSPVYE